MSNKREKEILDLVFNKLDKLLKRKQAEQQGKLGNISCPDLRMSLRHMKMEMQRQIDRFGRIQN